MSALRILFLMLVMLLGGHAHASVSFDNASRASDEELDRMRGGFIVNLNGLEFLMAFSIERLTFINGELVSSMTLNPFALTPLEQFGQVMAALKPPVSSGGESLAASQDSGSQVATSKITTPAAPDAVVPWDTPESVSVATADSGSAAKLTGSSSASSTETLTAQSSSSAADTSATAATSPQVTSQNGLTVIQNGPGNQISLPSNISANALTTVIQNSLNDQVIRNVTIMNATIAAQLLAGQARLNAMLNQSLNGLR